jgi:hypothetical protein
VALAAALLLFGSLSAKPLIYPDFELYGLAGGDRRLAETIGRRAGEGDALLCTSLTRASLAYYLSRPSHASHARGPLPLFSFPRDTASHLGSQNDARWLADPAALGRELSQSLEAARQALGPDGRLWIARVPEEVNRGLAPPALERRGWSPTVRLGPYQQTDTGQRILLEAYEPPR